MEAEDHKVEDSQDAGVAYTTTAEVPRICEQLEVKAEVFKLELNRRIQKTTT